MKGISFRLFLANTAEIIRNGSVPTPDLTYIDLEITSEGDGLQWNCCEKTYDLVDKINLVIDLMRKEFPDFGLSGEMLAQGEERKDKWRILIDSSGYAVKTEREKKPKSTCPTCKGK